MNRHLPRLLIFTLGVSALQGAGIENGDIVFQRSRSGQAEAIAAATRSEFTHVGVVFITNGRPFVYEAVQPVKRTPLDEWIKRGAGGRHVVKRLRDRAGIDFAAVHKQANEASPQTEDRRPLPSKTRDLNTRTNNRKFTIL